MVFGIGAFVLLFRLTTPSWGIDEEVWAHAGYGLVVEGDLTRTLEHPPLTKEILGVSQALGGEGLSAVRIPAALASLMTGLTLFLFGVRAASPAVGGLAALLWFTLPQTFWPWAEDISRIKIGRFGVGDVFSSLFMLVALFGGWLWLRSGHWRWVAVTSVFVGLAASAKVPGVLVLPGILAAGLIVQRNGRRVWLQAAAILSAATAVWLATYLPFGRMADDAVRYMLEFQFGRYDSGHAVVVAGMIDPHPPWWSHLWWSWKVLGTAGSVSLLGAVVLGVGLSRRRDAFYVLGAVLVPLTILSFLVSFKLPHHALIWQAPLMMLAAMGVVEVFRRGPWGRLVAVLVLVPLVVLGSRTLLEVGHIERSDYAAASDLLRAADIENEPIVVLGWSHILTRYLPGLDPMGPEAVDEARAVVRDDVFAWLLGSQDVNRYLDEHAQSFDRYFLDGVSVFVRSEPSARA